jgi:polyhydroxybutyrate depolymerase
MRSGANRQSCGQGETQEVVHAHRSPVPECYDLKAAPEFPRQRKRQAHVGLFMDSRIFGRSMLCALLYVSAASAAGGEGVETLSFGGLTRSYVLREPAQPRGTLPLVIVLHGGGGNAANAENMTGFTAKARKEGFIVVYPNGTGPLEDKLLTWNAGHCCAYAMKQDIDDVGFIDALIDELIARHPVDARRIYITGMSNGGMMTHRAGRELSGRIAAIAPVVATVFGDESKPAHPVPALIINGMLDENVPYQGGAPGGRGARSWDGTPALPALKQAEFWAAANGCKPTPDKDENTMWILWRSACPSTADVLLYLVKDNGHAWPGGQPGSRRGDTPGTALNATDVIWDFFKAHSK